MGRGEEREKDSTEMQERKRRRRIADFIYPSITAKKKTFFFGKSFPNVGGWGG